MACYRPLSAHQDRTSGSVRLGLYHAGEQGDKLELPCGRCIGCKMDRARAWSIRCMHEAQLYDSNLFLTLDYAPEHLSSPSLEVRDFQGFMKRLRRSLRGVSPGPNGKYPIRFFAAGEYGEQYGRPHWHALLFNCDFRDKVRYMNDTFRSSHAERLWGRGNVVIGAVTPQSAAYVAGYTTGKVKDEDREIMVDLATGEVSSVRREFAVMSRRPGIGAWWFDRFGSDVLPNDFTVMEGSKFKVPRYYLELYKRTAAPERVEEVSHSRLMKAREKPDRIEESSERRRLEREEVARAKFDLYGPRKH